MIIKLRNNKIIDEIILLIKSPNEIYLVNVTFPLNSNNIFQGKIEETSVAIYGECNLINEIIINSHVLMLKTNTFIKIRKK